jgi:nifR3 family TIM-barrel protein
MSLAPAHLQVGDVRIGGRVLAAPMTGVTDLPFRQVLSGLGAAYVATEMVGSADLALGRPEAIRRAAVGEGLPLTVIQLLGADPELLASGARIAEAAGADLIDLNLGCPSKLVTGVAAGSALMRDLGQAEAILSATVEATRRPVTLKMRLGWDERSINAAELARRAQDAGIRAITVHGRTRSQFYSGQADWRAVGEVKRAVRIPVIVNGDIVDAPSARAALEQSGADAVMIGRGAYGRPWMIAGLEAALAGRAPPPEPGPEARFAIVIDHLEASLAFHGRLMGLRIFRKHLGWYLDQAPWPTSLQRRREAKASLFRLDDPNAVREGLARLWGAGMRAAA